MLPHKPSFQRVFTLLAALMGGWLMGKRESFARLKICMDVEYALLRYLLEELVPLVFFFYSTIIRGSIYDLWKPSMIRLSLMFMLQKRHHYNKSMIAMTSDFLHYETVIPQWLSFFSSNLGIPTRSFTPC